MELFGNGWNKVQDDIDITNIVLELKSLRFITKSLLSKRQRFMIQYFKQNVINYSKKPKIWPIGKRTKQIE